MAKAKEIIELNPDESFILWHDLEEEGARNKAQIPEAVAIWGSMDYDTREKKVIDFRRQNKAICHKKDSFRAAVVIFSGIVIELSLSA